MLDNILESSIPQLSQRTAMTMAALPNQFRKMNTVNQSLHSTDNCVTSNNFLSRSQTSQESTEDEFSDFQSALPVSTFPLPHATGVRPETGVAGVGLGSPLHLTHPPAVRPKQISSVKAQSRGTHKASVVGSRLANYDLGLPIGSPRINQQVNRTATVIQPEVPTFAANFSKNAAEGLLIGDEDKYSALRGLTDEAPSVLSVFDAVGDPNTGCSVEHTISLVSDDVLEIVKTETTDSSLDFGDFQSFSSSIATCATYQAQKSSNELTSSALTSPRDLGDIFSFSFKSTGNDRFNSFDSFGVKPDLPTVAAQDSIPSTFSDGEFGDFVSFSNAGSAAKKSTVQDPSPKVAVVESVKKTTNVLSSTKPKRIHSSGKVNATKLVKASNILTDSPTFPKHNTITMDDPSLLYESSSVFTRPMPFVSSSDGFSFCSPAPRTDDLSIDILKKSDIFESYSAVEHVRDDIDDFGDFAGVQQVPTLDSKINTLDLLVVSSKPCAAETLSLASLDLGSYLEIGDGKVSSETDITPDSPGTVEYSSFAKDDKGRASVETSPSSISVEKVLIVNLDPEMAAHSSIDGDDKYKCFKEEVENERERCTSEWTRCLTTCLNLITSAVNIFNSVSSSEVIREIVSNDKGCSYVLNLLEVYLVADRICYSWDKIGGGMKMKLLHKDIKVSWEMLSPFFLGTSVMENVNQVENGKQWDKKDNAEGDKAKVCGVCLVNAGDGNQETLIDYGGKYYHSTCANLWINEVDTILPSLYCFLTL